MKLDLDKAMEAKELILKIAMSISTKTHQNSIFLTGAGKEPLLYAAAIIENAMSEAEGSELPETMVIEGGPMFHKPGCYPKPPSAKLDIKPIEEKYRRKEK